jgi:glutathione synthase/RimK-type ligase-like ATP-grasp enzyme
VTDLAIFYEHPDWLRPLFAALDRRGVDYLAIHADGHVFDPEGGAPPAPLIFNRIAMSSFLRQADHPIFYARSLLAQWADEGARVINGPEAMAVDASKARQLSLIASLGYAIPKTRAAHRPADLVAAAADLAFPIVVKANIGGSGAGIVRFDSLEALAATVDDGLVPESIDRVWLAQEYAPVRGGQITRLETLGGRFLYALEVNGGGGFDLCPADACLAQPGKAAVTIKRTEPSADLIEAAERIVRAAQMDIGGVEVLVDDRDGVARFYDINGFSNFAANPLGVLGWDPHETLVDWLEGLIEKARP